MITVLLTIAAVVIAEINIKKRIEALPPEKFPIELFGGRVQIKRAHNPGLIMGILGQKQLVANILSASAMIAVFVYTVSRCAKGMAFAAKLGWSLILGGGIANIYDRIKHKHVTDYVSFPRIFPKKIRKLIYNIGDFCVFIGAVLAAIFDR